MRRLRDAARFAHSASAGRPFTAESTVTGHWSYNAGGRIDSLFEELLQLSRRLDEDAQRHVREQMSEEVLWRGHGRWSRKDRVRTARGHPAPRQQQCPGSDVGAR